jgi:hypothetical protein
MSRDAPPLVVQAVLSLKDIVEAARRDGRRRSKTTPKRRGSV